MYVQISEGAWMKDHMTCFRKTTYYPLRASPLWFTATPHARQDSERKGKYLGVLVPLFSEGFHAAPHPSRPAFPGSDRDSHSFPTSKHLPSLVFPAALVKATLPSLYIIDFILAGGFACC